jgi:hypothetical protein
METHGYRFADEPDPSALSRFAVRPFWPLLGLMLGGAWLAWPWFVLNGLALGSPTRRKELGLAIAGFATVVVCALVLVVLLGLDVIDTRVARYSVLGITVIKLGFGYWITTLQDRTYPLYEHFGGTVRNGAGVVMAAFVVRFLMAELPLFYWLVLG